MRDTTAEESSSRCGRYFLARALGAAQRGLRVLHERVRVVAVVGITREPALHIDRNASAVDGERRAEHLGHLLLEPVHGLVFVAIRFQDQSERAATEMREQLGGIEVALQPVRHLLQQQVARVPPERIVERREMLDVEHRDRRRATPPDARLGRAPAVRRTVRAWRDR